MKNQPTKAQQEAARKRRAKFYELSRAIDALDEAGRAALAEKMLATTIEGRTLSFHNQCLIAHQRADVTLIGGFHQWRQAGRSVRKGEHGMMIWCPTGGKAAQDGGDDAEQMPDGGKPGFIVGTVFDISQTEAAEGRTR